MRQTIQQGSIRQPWDPDAETELDWGYDDVHRGCPASGCRGCESEEHARLAGSVVDEEGHPVPGFTVVVHWRPFKGCIEQAGSRVLTTDRSGRYSVAIPCCGHCLVSFEEDPGHFNAEDFEPSEESSLSAYGSWFEPVNWDADVEWPSVSVRRVGSISGRVRDADGRPLSDVYVGLTAGSPGSEDRTFGFCAETTTDDAGLFCLTGIKCLTGTLDFASRSDEHITTSRVIGGPQADTGLDFSEHHVLQDIEVELPRAVCVRLSLADRDGRPLVSSVVRPVARSGAARGAFIPQSLWTDEHGDASMRLPEGWYVFEASVPTGAMTPVGNGGAPGGRWVVPETIWIMICDGPVHVKPGIGEIHLKCALEHHRA